MALFVAVTLCNELMDGCVQILVVLIAGCIQWVHYRDSATSVHLVIYGFHALVGNHIFSSCFTVFASFSRGLVKGT